MDAAKKVQFERLLVGVMLVVLVFTLRGSLASIGLLGASRLTSPPPAPPPTPAARPASPRTERASVDQAATSSARPKREGSPEPAVQYTAVAFRDPLVSLLPVEPSSKTQPKSFETPAPSAIRPPPVTLQGMIWGGPRPQAVIDGDVYDVGDAVAGATIVKITRRGVIVDVQGTTFELTPATLNHDSAGAPRSSTLYPY